MALTPKITTTAKSVGNKDTNFLISILSGHSQNTTPNIYIYIFLLYFTATVATYTAPFCSIIF
jgi:hypothetical protein